MNTAFLVTVPNTGTPDTRQTTQVRVEGHEALITNSGALVIKKSSGFIVQIFAQGTWLSAVGE